MVPIPMSDSETPSASWEVNPSNLAFVEELYLAFLSRPPTTDERRDAIDYLAKGDRRRAAEDLAWSLLNTLEFVFNH